MKRMVFIEMDFTEGLPAGVVDSNLEQLTTVFESIIELTGFSNSTIVYAPDSDAGAEMQNVFKAAMSDSPDDESYNQATVFIDDMCTVFEWPKG